MDLAKITMLVGLPGSGKSVYAEKLKEKGYIVHSSDKIREELGDVNDQSRNEEVFNILHKRIKDDLMNGKNVCYDATNLNRRRRIAFIRELKNILCKKDCVLIATPYEMCMAQNIKRERKVPFDVIFNMLKSFNMPSTYEGFDSVVVHYPSMEWKRYYGNVFDFLNNHIDYDQENSNHSLTLSRHLLKAYYYMCKKQVNMDELYMAAIMHDVGKPWTKSFEDRNGNIDTNAHYYSHHNVGAYINLFIEQTSFDYDKQYVSLLIEHHMKPYMEWKQSEKTKEKDRELFGDQFIKGVELIHEADVYAK